MMDNELAEQFKRDLKRIQTLKVPWIPGKILYKRVAKNCAVIYGSLYLPALALFFLRRLIYKLPVTDDFYLLVGHVLCFDFFALLGILSFIVFLVLLPTINAFTLFQLAIKDKLETGCFLERKVYFFVKMLWVVFVFFLTLVYLALIYLGAPLVAAGSFASFLLTGFIGGRIIDLEVQRLGLTVFFDAMSKFLEKKRSFLGEEETEIVDCGESEPVKFNQGLWCDEAGAEGWRRDDNLY
jgi:hypothetical protein